jgi:hypothetical protein
MQHLGIRFSIFQFIFCTTLLFLSSCGKGGDASKSLAVNLSPPVGYTAESFWLGVTQKKLIVQPQNGDKQEIPWGSSADLDLKKGDHLRFEGSGAEGQLLVFGDVDVGDENPLSIPLQRAL